MPVPPSQLGESPMWHPQEAALYWCDIAGHALNRWRPSDGHHDVWPFHTEVASCAPLLGGGLLLALRDGLWRFDPTTDHRRQLVAAPYPATSQRFNDGKADPQGRFWVGTLDDAREFRAALYRWDDGRLERMFGDVAVSNGLAWSADGATLYWSDTKRHTVYAFDFDGDDGSVSNRRELALFAPKTPDAPYGGRPDGAAVDAEGCYWVAMYEGARLLRLSPRGEVLHELALPVQCPTMPAFGGADLKTLYVTTARAHRPADELQRQPWAGRVLQVAVEVPGLPANFVSAAD